MAGMAAKASDRLEGMFDEQVAKALERLDVPLGSEVDALTARIETLERTVAALAANGVEFEEYDFGTFKTVDHIVTTAGVGRSAWFKDPDGNTIAVFQPE